MSGIWLGIFRQDDPPPATAFEEFSDDELREDDHEMRQPEPARAPPGGYPRRDGDVEMAQNRPPPNQETGRMRRG